MKIVPLRITLKWSFNFHGISETTVCFFSYSDIEKACRDHWRGEFAYVVIFKELNDKFILPYLSYGPDDQANTFGQAK